MEKVNWMCSEIVRNFRFLLFFAELWIHETEVNFKIKFFDYTTFHYNNKTVKHFKSIGFFWAFTLNRSCGVKSRRVTHLCLVNYVTQIEKWQKFSRFNWLYIRKLNEPMWNEELLTRLWLIHLDAPQRFCKYK